RTTAKSHRSHVMVLFFMTPPPPTSTLFPYTTLFRSATARLATASASASADSGGTRYPVTPSTTRSTGPPAAGATTGSPLDLVVRSEEHTSELQSLRHLVCRLLLEKKKHTSNV